MAACKLEETSGDLPRAFVDLLDIMGFAQPVQCKCVVDWFQLEIGRKLEGKSTRQDETVPDIEQDWVRDAFDDQPALAGEHGVALDAPIPGEADGQVARHDEAPGDQALWLEQGEHLGKRIHVLRKWLEGRRPGVLIPGSLSLGVLRCQDDWTNHTDS